MNKLPVLLISTFFYCNVFANLPPTEKNLPSPQIPISLQKSEPSRALQLLIAQAAELDAVLTLDKEFYESHVCDRERSEEFRRPLMAEFVAHVYLIPSIRTSLALIKQLAQQEKTDPEMDNLKLAVAAIPPLELKYLRPTYDWQKDSSTPVHPKANATPLNSQQVLVKTATRHYQQSMHEYLSAYKQQKLEASSNDQQALDRLKDKLDEAQRGDAPKVPAFPHGFPLILSKDH
jgi:hypothetical protein